MKVLSSLRSKLSIALALLSVVPLLALTYFVGIYISEQSKADKALSITREITQVDNAFTVFIEDMKADTLYFSGLPLIKTGVGAITTYADKKATTNDGTIPMTPLQNGGQEAEIFRTFQHYKKYHPMIAATFIGSQNTGGYMQLPESARKAGYDARTRPWYKLAAEHKGQVMVTNPYLLSSDQTVAVSIVTAVMDEANVVTGVFGFDIALDNLAQMVKNIKIGQSGYVILTSVEGTILAHPMRPELLNKNMKDIAPTQFEKFADIKSGVYPVYIDGKNMMMNVFASQNLGWKFVAAVDESEFLASTNTIQKNMALVALLIFATAILLNVFFVISSLEKKVLARTNELQDTVKKLTTTQKLLEETNEALLESNKQLDLSARTDSLTGLNNRRYMTEKTTEEFARFLRHGKVFSLAIADIDCFKAINDTQGHLIGSSVLKSVADDLRGVVREYDIVARWGGDEFLFLFPETDLEQARIVAERIRQKIAEKIYLYDHIELNVTMTFGVSSIRSGDSEDDLMKRADKALYEGKNAGRNCVVAK